jgi:hypothetical protein
MFRLLSFKRHPFTQYFSRQNLICASSILSPLSPIFCVFHGFMRITERLSYRAHATRHGGAFLGRFNLPLSETYKLQHTSCRQEIWSEVLTALVMNSSIFWDIVPFKVKRRFAGTCRLRVQGWSLSQTINRHDAGSKQRLMPVSCLAYSSTLKMKATWSSETSVDFQRTTRRYIPEDRTLQEVHLLPVCMYVLLLHISQNTRRCSGFYKKWRNSRN